MYEISVLEKKCSTCKLILSATEFYPHRRMKSGLQPSCRKCSRAWHRARPEYIREKNSKYKAKFPTYHRDWQRKAKYGVTPEQVEAIRVKQNYKCAGCLILLLDTKECVDHDHKTGKVRGLLCDNCNSSLGKLNDDIKTLERLIHYLAQAENYA